MRKDCGYSFCDKTRFVQHTARHDRLDTLMGGDFQQYRSNVSCGRSDCVYSSVVSKLFLILFNLLSDVILNRKLSSTFIDIHIRNTYI